MLVGLGPHGATGREHGQETGRPGSRTHNATTTWSSSTGARARADGRPSSEVTEAVAPIGDKMRAIQKYLTQARKAEGKARKIREDQIYRDQQWDAWAKQMKSSYVKQRKQYEADSAKAAEELQATLEAGQQAARNVELVVSGQLVSAMPATTEDTTWEDYHRIPEAPSHSETFMQEAMAAVQRAGLSSLGPPISSEVAPPTDAQAQALVKQLRPDILRQLLAMTSGPPTSAAAPPAQASADATMPSVYTGAPPAPIAESGVSPFPPSSPHPGRLAPLPEAIPEQKPVGERMHARTSPLHPGQRDPQHPAPANTRCSAATWHQGSQQGGQSSGGWPPWYQSFRETGAGQGGSHGRDESKCRELSGTGCSCDGHFQPRGRRPRRRHSQPHILSRAGQLVLATAPEGDLSSPQDGGWNSLEATPRCWSLWGAAINQHCALGQCSTFVLEGQVRRPLLWNAESNDRAVQTDCLGLVQPAEDLLRRLPCPVTRSCRTLAATRGKGPLLGVPLAYGRPSSSVGVSDHWACDLGTAAPPLQQPPLRLPSPIWPSSLRLPRVPAADDFDAASLPALCRHLQCVARFFSAYWPRQVWAIYR